LVDIGALLAFLSAVGFSLTNVLIRKGGRPGDADNGTLITTITNVIALSMIMAVLGFVRGSPLSTWNTTGFLWFAVAGFFTTFLGRNTLFGSIRRIGSSRAAAIKNTAPVFTVVIAVLFLEEHPTALATIGIGVASLGLFLLVHEAFQNRQSTRGRNNDREATEEVFGPEGLIQGSPVEPKPTAGAPSIVMIGILLAVFAAIFFGSGQAVRKVGIEYMPDAFFGAMIASWAALISYLATLAAQGRLGAVFRTSFESFNPYFWLAGLASTVGQLSFFAAVMFAPVSYVSVIAACETLLTIFFAVILLRRSEIVTRRVVIAATAVFAGAVLITLA
jgi:drug/metabolite transporter (DMT)-like permease